MGYPLEFYEGNFQRHLSATTEAHNRKRTTCTECQEMHTFAYPQPVGRPLTCARSAAGKGGKGVSRRDSHVTPARPAKSVF